jgi:SAM-dependent methyltransferase
MSTDRRDTDTDWKRVAEDDPYWGVLSKDDYRKDAMNPRKLEQFMATGERFIANIFGLIKKHLDPDFAPERALDFGCGVGRLLIPIAKRVREAVGVDVAPAMLDICRNHASSAGVDNITLVAGDDALTGVAGPFDFVNSYIVLQHIPPERGHRLIQELLDRLAIGGIASIQVTYAKSRALLVHEGPKAHYYRREGHTLVDVLPSDWSAPEGTINMFDYDMNQVMAQLSRRSGHPMIALPTNDDDHLGVHFVFAKAQ